MSALKKLCKIFNKREKIQALFIFLSSLLTGFMQAFGIFSIFPFIHVLLNQNMINENKYLSFLYTRFNFDSFTSFSIYLGLFVLVSIVFSNLISALTFWASTRFVMGRNQRISEQLFKKYLSNQYTFFLKNNSSELTKNIIDEVNRLTEHYLMSVLHTLTNSIILLFILAMLFIIDVCISLGALFVLGLPYLLINNLLKKSLQKKGKLRINLNHQRFSVISEAFSSIKITKTMGIESFFINKYHTSSRLYAKFITFAHTVGRMPYYLTESIAFGGIVLYIIVQLQINADFLSIIPKVSLFAFAGKRILPTLQSIYQSVSSMYFNGAVLEKIHNDLMPDNKLSGGCADNSEKINFTKSVKLQNASFTYPEAENTVLKDISLTIKKDTIVGFAGLTGSGKTTLIDVIMGLLQLYSGKFMIDDVCLNYNNIYEWQKKIGYVPQDTYLSDSSIKNNIAFGIDEEQIDFERVILSAKKAALHDFIQSELPEKYETIVGERGVRLSGGQKQRIGLARALYRNPEVLILDEATSSLDGITEEKILKSLKNSCNTMTIIMIAHRLNTLKDCDVIYILEDGFIKESGTYSQLLIKSDRFNELGKNNKLEGDL